MSKSGGKVEANKCNAICNTCVFCFTGAYINKWYLTKRQMLMCYYCYHKFGLGLPQNKGKTFIVPAQTSPVRCRSLTSIEDRGVFPCLPPAAIWMIFNQERGGRFAPITPQEAFALQGMSISDFFAPADLQTLHEWMRYSDLIRLAGNSFCHTCAGRFALAFLSMSRLEGLGRIHRPRSGKSIPSIAPWQQSTEAAAFD